MRRGLRSPQHPEEKRQIYDRYGHEGLRGQGSGFGNAEDVFSHFGDIFGDLFGFGGGGGRGRSRGRRGQDLKYVLELDFREAAFGVKKKIEVTKHEACVSCRGSGAKAGSTPETCRACGGRGQVVHGSGMFLISQTGPECRGEGKTIKEHCPDCRGSGHKKVHKEVEVDVPAGFADNMSLRYSGHGEPGDGGGPAGDWYVVGDVLEHESFVRVSDQIKAMGGIKTLNFYMMGEPLVNRDLPQFVKIARQKQIADRVILTSNGSLLGEDAARRLIEAGLDYLRISIYGGNASAHARKTQSKVPLDRVQS